MSFDKTTIPLIIFTKKHPQAPSPFERRHKLCAHIMNFSLSFLACGVLSYVQLPRIKRRCFQERTIKDDIGQSCSLPKQLKTTQAIVVLCLNRLFSQIFSLSPCCGMVTESTRVFTLKEMTNCTNVNQTGKICWQHTLPNETPLSKPWPFSLGQFSHRVNVSWFVCFFLCRCHGMVKY